MCQRNKLVEQTCLSPLPDRPQAITSACVASLSDIIAQRLIGTPYSLQRTLKMAVSQKGDAGAGAKCGEVVAGVLNSASSIVLNSALAAEG